MRFGEVETALILASYGESFRQPNTFPSTGELQDRYVIDPVEGWVHQIVADLGRRGLIYGKGVMGDERSQPFRLTAAGMREAERLIDHGKVVHERTATQSEAAIESGVPASDRVVQLDHNQVQEIEVPLNEVLQALERENGDIADPPLRQRIVGQLRAGRELVRAGEFNAHLLYLTVVHALNELIERYGGKTLAALANALLGVLAAKVFQ